MCGKHHVRRSYALPDINKSSTSITRPLCINQIILPILLPPNIPILLLPVRIIPRILIPLRPRLRPSRPLIKLVQNLRRDAIEEFLGIDAQQAPGEVYRFVDGSGLVGRLRDEGAFELVEEFERELVFGR